jgi:hypothetical protein
MMILKPDVLFEKCIIRPSNSNQLNIDKYERNGVADIAEVATEVTTEANEVLPARDNITVVGEDANLNYLGYDLESTEISTPQQKIEYSTETEQPTCLTNTHSLNTNTKDNHSNKSELDKHLIVSSRKMSDIDHVANYDDDELVEVEFDFDNLRLDEDPISLRDRNEIYRNLYNESVKKAKEARNLAISAYLESTRIKKLYMIDDTNENT